jgi:hypothetical protein
VASKQSSGLISFTVCAKDFRRINSLPFQRK